MMLALPSKPLLEVQTRTRSDREITFHFERVVREGCYQSFKWLFQKQYNALCQYAQRIVDSHEIAEEVVADVFVKLWKNRQQIEVNFSYKAYLYRSVRNQALDYLKSKANTISSLTSELDYSSNFYSMTDVSPEEIMQSNEIVARIENAIDRLPKQCRLIFRMSRDQQLKYHEIAAQLGLSVKTIETQMGRALAQLRIDLASLRNV